MQAHGSGGWSAVSNTLYLQAPTRALNYTLDGESPRSGNGEFKPIRGELRFGIPGYPTATPTSGWQFPAGVVTSPAPRIRLPLR